MEEAKKLGTIKSRAELSPLPKDPKPLTEKEQFWRKLRQRFVKHIIK
jgi:hypothetical protein